MDAALAQAAEAARAAGPVDFDTMPLEALNEVAGLRTRAAHGESAKFHAKERCQSAKLKFSVVDEGDDTEMAVGALHVGSRRTQRTPGRWLGHIAPPC